MEKLSVEEIQAALSDLPRWSGGEDGLYREFRFSDFSEAFAFMTRVAFLAEAHGHHPEIQNVYSRVGLRLNTHDAGDKVTLKDVQLARAIQDLTQS